jgi:hypothetical protein
MGNLAFSTAALGGIKVLTGASVQIKYVIERRSSNETWTEIRNIPWANTINA